MFGIGDNKNTPVYGVLFDIGSGSVGVAVVEFDINKPTPNILFSHRTQMRITEHTAKRDILLRKVREAVFSSALLLSQDGLTALKSHNRKARISKMYVSCASPWSYNLTRTVDYTDDEPFKITNSIIEDLTRGAEESIFSDMHQNSKNDEDTFQVVERASVDISVNDYSVADPIDLKGSSVSLSHIVGLIPREVSDSIIEVQEKLYPDSETKIHTYMLIMYCTLRDVLTDFDSLCIIDITGEAVECGLVEGGLIIQNIYIHSGTSTFLRAAVKSTGRPVADIKTAVQNFDDNSLGSKKLDELVQKYIELYASELVKIMQKKVIPKDIVITADRSYEVLFTYIFEEAFKIAANKKLKIKAIDEVLKEEIATGINEDVYLVIEAYFFHKLHGCMDLEAG